MPNYRRATTAGGTFFFTVNTFRRQPFLTDEDVRGALREGIELTRQSKPFIIHAWVLLPDHLHCIWTLPPGNADYAGRWHALKSRFTQALRLQGVPLHADARGEYRLWQRRYWEHTIRDEEDWQRHVEYIHSNPVKHGLVERVADWPCSSFHRWVKRGDLPLDWAGGSVIDAPGDFGE